MEFYSSPFGAAVWCCRLVPLAAFGHERARKCVNPFVQPHRRNAKHLKHTEQFFATFVGASSAWQRQQLRGSVLFLGNWHQHWTASTITRSRNDDFRITIAVALTALWEYVPWRKRRSYVADQRGQ